jgi:hypothetical protein
MAAARKSSRYGHRDATMILIGYRHGLRAYYPKAQLKQGADRDMRQNHGRRASKKSLLPLSSG